MFTLESFQKKYNTTRTKVVVRDQGFTFYRPETLDSFIQQDDIFDDFPLWVKIWEPSYVLAEYLAGLKVEKEKSFLEIGCGLGLIGIVASFFGHDITMTEHNEDALDFCRANTLLNIPSPHSRPVILKLDWNKTEIKKTFDYIIGSEITYKESDFQPILNLFRGCLKDGGEIILSGAFRKTTIQFMRQMSDIFHITAQKKILRSKYNEIHVMLCRLKFK